MKSSIRAYLLSFVVACTVMTGCAQDTRVMDADMRDRIETELGTVERVTVMSTDGQEVMLDLPAFLNELQTQGKDLQLSNDPLKQEEVLFTLVLYRKQLAQLVVTVGERASQFGESTYRGPGAVTFYEWVHRLTGNGLLKQGKNNMVLSAEDLSQSLALAEKDTVYIQKVLSEAVPENEKNLQKYPLYPNYRLRIDSEERPLDVTVLTPTLISIPFGRDTHFYHVDGKLFSQLTEYLVPKEMAIQPFDKLFKATAVRFEKTGQMAVDNLDLDVTQSTVEQGLAQQAVRMLKTAAPIEKQPDHVGAEEYRVHFKVNGEEHSVIFYSLHFQIDDKWYLHNQLQKAIWDLLKPSRK